VAGAFQPQLLFMPPPNHPIWQLGDQIDPFAALAIRHWHFFQNLAFCPNAILTGST